jgi:hypothetical protein
MSSTPKKKTDSHYCSRCLRTEQFRWLDTLLHQECIVCGKQLILARS